MAVGWPLVWVVLTLLVGHLHVSAAAADNHNIPQHLHPSSRSLQAPQTLLSSDAQALLSFKHRILLDPHRVLSEWDLQIRSNCCDWVGITCAHARVVVINLNGSGLLAPLDPIAALAPLEQLQELHLANNSFYSRDTDQLLPFGCGSNGALTTLDLSSNKLNSSFSNLRNCTSLAYLNISRNALHGAVPSVKSLGDAGSLQSIDLSYNFFSGALSSEVFRHCGTLSWLDLSSNILMGPLPSGISACASLQHLNLSFNSFNGTLPADFFPSSTITSNLITVQLSSNNLSGILLPIVSCANLAFFDIADNLFTGNLPPFLSGCTSLRVLNLSRNAFTGNLPTFLTSLVNLEILSVSKNNLTGTIWPGIGNTLLALQELYLTGNDLVGTLPPSLSNCSKLRVLSVRDNSLSGEFPVEVVSRMPALQTLSMSFNYITGSLPVSLGNASSSLSVLDISANSLTGTIPGTLCSPSLTKLLLADNGLYGAVPLESCRNLVSIDVSCNFINSTFPKPLPVLPYMQEFIMWGNFIAEEIPSDICAAAGQLRLLILNANLINGTLPPTLANCSRLEWLSLAGNRLTGPIPPEFGLLLRLNFLHLNNNSLSGIIPPSLGDCKSLVWVDLSSNRLEGKIPPELAKQSGKVHKGTLDNSLHIAFFKYLKGDVCTQHGLGSLLAMRGVRPERLYKIPSFRSCSHTRLYMSILPYYFPGPSGPVEGGSYIYLDLAHNRLQGTIPAEFGTMSYLTVLSLSYNNLTGSIPYSLVSLVHVSILHLDHNHLQGPIPPGLSDLGILNQLDLSSNNLSGSIPDSGKLPTFPESCFTGNPYLCGTPLPECESKALIFTMYSPEIVGSRLRPSILDIILMCVALSLLLLLFVFMRIEFVQCKRGRREEAPSEDYEENADMSSDDEDVRSPRNQLSINIATFEQHLRKLTYQHLWEATNGFSNAAIIGKGGFGQVYKASIANGTVVAIKKLSQLNGHSSSVGDKQFLAEIETLGKIKHRHLVPLLGYCRTAEERLLVYQYMEGGSLDNWLHPKGEPQSMELTWDRRKRVALGMAKGLCFLHHCCIPHIIHRDFKSGNVLLDDTMEARLSDFGMALLLSAIDQHVSVSGLVGTPGYVPPEYCQNLRCTKQGDVYSFGVVLLELITGRCPNWSTSDLRKGRVNGTTHTMLEGEGDGNAVASLEEHEEEGGDDLAGWVKRHIAEGKAREVLDKRTLHGGSTMMETVDLRRREREMLAYLRIAYQCVHERPSKRPSMKEVVVGFRELHQGEDLDLLQ